MTASRTWLAAGGAIVALAAIFVLTSTLWRYGVDGPLTNAIDFRAFYCAGSALDAGGDPYRVEPVRSCERESLRVAGFSFAEKDVYVAPYPPLAIVPFAALARLPYRIAVETWMTLNIAALCLAIVLAARLAALRPIYAALALAASVGFASLFYGQPIPLVVAALLVAALAARARSGAGVACGLLVASLQPQLAAPAWVAAFSLLPYARRPIAFAFAAALAIGAVCFSHLTSEYVFTVLPMHARAEIANFANQYGLSALLRYCGVPIDWALRLGSLSYAAMTAIGIAVAARARTIFADDAFAVLAPPAFVTIGGTFVHGHQLAVALPFALLLVSYVRRGGSSTVAAVLVAAIAALATPWQIIADEPGVNAFFPHVAYVKPPPFRRPAADELIDRSYTERQDALAGSNERTPAVQIAWKLPTWFALLALAIVAIAVVRTPQRIAR